MRIELVKELIMEFGVKNVYYNEQFGEVQIDSIVYNVKNARLVNNCLELFSPEFEATAIIGYDEVRTEFIEFVEESNMDCVLYFLDKNNIEMDNTIIDLDEDLIIVNNGEYEFEVEQCGLVLGIDYIFLEDKDGYVLKIFDDGDYMVVLNNEIVSMSLKQ